MEKPKLKVLLPDGSLKDVVEELLTDAGMPVSYQSSRTFRGVLRGEVVTQCVDPVVLQLRPWDMGPLVANGQAHLAIAADDMLWNSNCIDGTDVMVLDRYPLSRAGNSATNVVVAVSEQSQIASVHKLTDRHVLATEYYDGVRRWLDKQGISVNILPCHGKLEAYQDLGVDAIVDNVETGTSLQVNGWRILETILLSQTCLFANPSALHNEALGPAIRTIVLLLRAVIDGRAHVVVTCNVGREKLDDAVRAVQQYLGDSGSPTIADLAAAKSAARSMEIVVLRSQLPEVLATLHRAGCERIITGNCEQYIA